MERCKICGAVMDFVSNRHIATHDISREDYNAIKVKNNNNLFVYGKKTKAPNSDALDFTREQIERGKRDKHHPGRFFKAQRQQRERGVTQDTQE